MPFFDMDEATARGADNEIAWLRAFTERLTPPDRGRGGDQ